MTDRLTINGWTVYLQERPNGAVATVRSAPWTRSQPLTPLASFVAASPMAALRHVERWVQQQAPEASSQEEPAGSEPSPWRDHQRPMADDQRRQAQILEARKLLGAEAISDRRTLRHRFRELAKLHHPDHGGERVQWDRLHGAYKFLDFYLAPQLPDSYDSQIKDG